MPKIGMRIIKSALAVFICCAIGYLRGGGYPFYSAIAAILCMQKELDKGIEIAKDRMMGTCIGGICGYVGLLIIQLEMFSHPLIQYGVLSLCIIAVMYITLLVGRQDAIYIACVVFLCVTISHGDNNVSAALFAFNRVIDTFIGIVVALLINHNFFTYKDHSGKSIDI